MRKAPTTDVKVLPKAPPGRSTAAVDAPDFRLAVVYIAADTDGMQTYFVARSLLAVTLVWAVAAYAGGSAAPARGDALEGIPVAEYPAGTLLYPANPRDCARLQVYFPGFAQEIGLTRKVPRGQVRAWHRLLLSGETEYALAGPIRRDGCPVLLLNDSSTVLSRGELQSILATTEATQVELISHSGGYEGLEATINAWSSRELGRVVSLGLLDNFYAASTAMAIARQFGARARSLCRGFTTPHNRPRFDASFAAQCPDVSHFASGHKSRVRGYF